MGFTSREYRDEYLAELCDRVVAILDEVIDEYDNWSDANKDLRIRLRNTAEHYRVCKKDRHHDTGT